MDIVMFSLSVAIYEIFVIEKYKIFLYNHDVENGCSNWTIITDGRSIVCLGKGRRAVGTHDRDADCCVRPFFFSGSGFVGKNLETQTFCKLETVG